MLIQCGLIDHNLKVQNCHCGKCAESGCNAVFITKSQSSKIIACNIYENLMFCGKPLDCSSSKLLNCVQKVAVKSKNEKNGNKI